MLPIVLSVSGNRRKEADTRMTTERKGETIPRSCLDWYFEELRT